MHCFWSMINSPYLVKISIFLIIESLTELLSLQLQMKTAENYFIGIFNWVFSFFFFLFFPFSSGFEVFEVFLVGNFC